MAKQYTLQLTKRIGIGFTNCCNGLSFDFYVCPKGETFKTYHKATLWASLYIFKPSEWMGCGLFTFDLTESNNILLTYKWDTK